MKRILTAATAAALVFLFAACFGGTSSSGSGAASSGSSGMSSGLQSSGGSGSSGAADSGSSNVRVGVGAVATTSDSAAATSDAAGNAKFGMTVCAVSVDGSGKILDVRFDDVQTGVGFNFSGAFTGDPAAEIKTGRELGFDYGLKTPENDGSEWFEQMDTLEGWMRGKSLQDVLSMKMTSGGDAGQQLPDEDGLRDSVTIPVSDHLRALEKAYNDATRGSVSTVIG